MNKIDQKYLNYMFLCMMNATELTKYNQPKEIIEKTYDELLNSLNGYELDPNNYTIEELLNIGFRLYSKDTPLYLCPIWFFCLIPDDVELENIEGEKFLKKDITNTGEIRLGMTSFGIRK